MSENAFKVREELVTLRGNARKKKDSKGTRDCKRKILIVAMIVQTVI